MNPKGKSYPGHECQDMVVPQDKEKEIVTLWNQE